MAQLSISFPSGVTTYVADAYAYDRRKLSYSGETFYDVNYCGRFCVYYTNARGGWDAYLFESPKWTRKDTMNSFEYSKAYVNTTHEFGRNKYVTELIPTWALNTSWMSEGEAERFAKNLIPSQCVYLHDLDEDRLWPVTITDTSAEYKTNINQNRQGIRYAVNFKASQDLVRR